MDSLYDLWRQVLPFLHEDLGDTVFNVWIKPLIPIQMTAEDFILKAPSSVHRDIVSVRFKAAIGECIKSLLGIDLNVRMVIEDELEKLIKPLEDMQDEPYEYTFDSFIVGPSNRFAHAAAIAAAQNPGGAYNPLLIYGDSGLGKTHLLFAIREYILRKNPSFSVVYIKGDQFTNELIAAINKGQQLEFRQKYRYADVLLMDDVHFIAGKVSTQEEFFHTFNTLQQENKQIILTSDRPPKEMKTLADRLRTRFESGVMADIQPPEFETRAAIIKRKAEQFSLNISDDTANFIASKLKANIRQIEGVVKKMNIICQMDGDRPSTAVAQQAIRDILSDVKPLPVTIAQVVEEVARAFEVQPEEIYSDKRAQPLSLARHAAMYCVRETTTSSYEMIGKEFGNRDHTSVIYAVQRIQSKMKKQPDFKALVDDIINNIKSN